MWNLGRTVFGFVLAAVLFAQAASAGQAQEYILDREVDAYLSATEADGGDPNVFKAYWDKGMRLESADGNTSIKFGGRVHFDAGWASTDDTWDAQQVGGTIDNDDTGEDYAVLSRVRLYVSGTIYKNTVFKWQVDFAKGGVSVKDAYIGLKNLQTVGNFRIGNMKEPAGLEEITSSKYDTFVLQSVTTEIFTQSRRVGLIFFNPEMKGDDGKYHLTWAVFVGRDTDGDDAVIEDNTGYQFVVRVTGLLLYKEGGDSGPTFLHLGVSYQFRNPEDDSYRTRARTWNRTGERAIDFTLSNIDDIQIIGFEIAYNMGSLSFQGEWFLQQSSALSGFTDPDDYDGFYVQISWFITGEHRPYSDKKASFGRVKPKNNWHDGGDGNGAWELTFRFDNTDVNDADLGDENGEWTGYTFGVNWYWNPNTRVMINYNHGEIEDLSNNTGEVDAIVLRFAVDF